MKHAAKCRRQSCGGINSSARIRRPDHQRAAWPAAGGGRLSGHGDRAGGLGHSMKNELIIARFKNRPRAAARRGSMPCSAPSGWIRCGRVSLASRRRSCSRQRRQTAAFAPVRRHRRPREIRGTGLGAIRRCCNVRSPMRPLRGASRRSVVSAAQAGGVVVDDVGQSVGYSAAVLQQLCHREINTETGAAGAAGLAM